MKYSHAITVAFECCLPTSEIRQEDMGTVLEALQYRTNSLRANYANDELLEVFESYDVFEEDD